VSETKFQRKLNHAWTCRSRDDLSDVRRFDHIERIGEAEPQRVSKRVIVLWLACKLLKTRGAVRCTLDSLGTG
jgi:hypothetical protein